MFKKVNPNKTTLGAKIDGSQSASSFRTASHSQRAPTPVLVQKKGKPGPIDPMSIMAAPQGRGMKMR